MSSKGHPGFEVSEEEAKDVCEVLQEKLERGDELTALELRFLEEVARRKELSEQLQQQVGTVRTLLSFLMGGKTIDQYEAAKRGITPQQWLDVLHIAEVCEKDREWLDKTFVFPGDGTIRTSTFLHLKKRSLRRLPDHLKIKGKLNVTDCALFECLPSGLEVGKDLHIERCPLIEELPQGLIVGDAVDIIDCEAFKILPQGFKVKGSLFIDKCPSLEKLPEGLEVGYYLSVWDCLALRGLPEGLQVGIHFEITSNMHQSIRDGAVRLGIWKAKANKDEE